MYFLGHTKFRAVSTVNTAVPFSTGTIALNKIIKLNIETFFRNIYTVAGASKQETIKNQ